MIEVHRVEVNEMAIRHAGTFLPMSRPATRPRLVRARPKFVLCASQMYIKFVLSASCVFIKVEPGAPAGMWKWWRSPQRPVFGVCFSFFVFWVFGLRLRVSGFRFRASGFEIRVSGFEFWVSGFRISGFVVRISGIGSRDSDFGIRFLGVRFQVSGFGF